MKNIFAITLTLAGFFLSSCSGSKKFQASVPEDKALFSTLNRLIKKPNDARARADFKILYDQALDRHESAVAAYRQSRDMNHYDLILRELNALQHIYNSLQSVVGDYGILKPESYLVRIEAVKEEAAEDFYERGNEWLSHSGRQNALQAYAYFNRSNGYVSGYKDVAQRIREAYAAGIVNIVINRIEDNQLYFASNMGLTDIHYRPADFQEALVRDLGGSTARQVPARFYTDAQARYSEIQPDWEVNIRWRNLDPVQVEPVRYTRNLSRSIEMARDSMGKPILKTIHAKLYITRETYQVRGNLGYEVMNLSDHQLVDQGLLSDVVSWTNSRATYSGDSRALSQEDWILVHNKYFNLPARGDVLNALMQKIYPSLRAGIREASQ